MVTADEARAQIRPDLGALIHHYCSTGLPKMGAYRRVASRIGRSPAWVQRVLGRDEDVTIGLHDALNIRAAYDRLCARIEAAADAIESDTKTRREARHAAGQGAPAGRARDLGVVARVADEEGQ